MWGVVALTVATFTVLLAVRRIFMAGSQLVFSRYVAVGGLAALSADHLGGGEYRVRFEAGGPAVFHNVSVQLLGVSETRQAVSELQRPALRHTLAAGDDPIEWTCQLPDDATERAWVMVTWVRPYLQGVESEALAQRLQTGRLYEWRWYSETNRYARTVIRSAARRWSLPAGASMRELPVYGRWRRTSSNTAADLMGPAATPPPIT